MSRHVHNHVSNGYVYSVEYGYDPPLQEYFVQVWPVGEVDPEFADRFLDDEDAPLFAVSSHTTMTCHPSFPDKIHWSNGEILELMQEWGCNPDHCHAVAMDLTF